MGFCFTFYKLTKFHIFFYQHLLSLGSSDGSLKASDVKYLEKFENPYVKIIIACKLCGKEQSLKYQFTWKRHYLTHTESKPFECEICKKSFIQQFQLKRHMKQHEKKLNKQTDVLSPGILQHVVKIEQPQSFPY